MKNNLLILNNATAGALEVLEELADITTKLEHIQDLAIEVKGSGALPVEAREELEDIVDACGVLIARGKE
tara:strand:+ start:611 stop:820 length:210 start_codon:yes stop_codon:yes gene_type:complete